MVRLIRAVRQAIRESDLDARQKLILRGLLLLPSFRSAVVDYFEEVIPDASTRSWGDLIELIIEKLPELLEFIELIIGLFRDESAGQPVEVKA